MPALLLLLLLLQCACGNTAASATQETASNSASDETVTAASAEATAAADETAEESDPLAGNWIADAILVNDKLVQLSDAEDLASMYSATWIEVSDDGTYLLKNGVFTYEGIWYTSWNHDYENAYTFEEQTCSHFAFGDLSSLETETTDSEGMYRVYLENDDTDVLYYVDPDLDNTLVWHNLLHYT